MSKFTGISFPFFGLKEKPYDIKFSLNNIEIKISSTDNQWKVVDDKSLRGNYFFRNVQMLGKKYTKVTFNYTCRDIKEIINSKCKWGVDDTAQIFDLTTKEKFKLTCKKIKKIQENMIWVEQISYPFEINTHEININEKYYITLVNVDKCWHPIEFSFSKHNRVAIYL